MPVKAKVPDFSRDDILNLLSYNKKTGVFVWKVRSGCAVAGRRAGNINSLGYRKIKVAKQTIAAHRLAWFILYGVWPESEIDHRDRNRDNNAKSNLRLATRSNNMGNTVVAPKHNHLGIRGVRQMPNGTFQTRIGLNGKLLHLGTFTNKSAAVKAYRAASKKLRGSFSPWVDKAPLPV